jgi:hypothetical protein
MSGLFAGLLRVICQVEMQPEIARMIQKRGSQQGDRILLRKPQAIGKSIDYLG